MRSFKLSDMILLLAFYTASTAHAGAFSRRQPASYQYQADSPCAGGRCPAPAVAQPARTYSQPIYSVPYTPAPVAAPQAAPAPLRFASYAATQAQGDPLAAVNQARAARGLRPLAYDASLTAWAAQNDSQQNARGLGHWATGGSMQCSAQCGSIGQAVAMWTGSRAHAALMFSPNATRAGISCNGRFASLCIR